MPNDLPPYLELMDWSTAHLEKWLKENTIDDSRILKEFKKKKIDGKYLANMKKQELQDMKSLDEHQQTYIWDAIQKVKENSLQMQNHLRDQSKRWLEKKKDINDNKTHHEDDDEDTYQDPGFGENEFSDDEDDEDYLEPTSAPRDNRRMASQLPPKSGREFRKPPPVPQPSQPPPSHREPPPVPRSSTQPMKPLPHVPVLPRGVPSPPEIATTDDETYEAVDQAPPPSVSRLPPPVPRSSRLPPPVPPPSQSEPEDQELYEELPDEQEKPRSPPPVPRSKAPPQPPPHVQPPVRAPAAVPPPRSLPPARAPPAAVPPPRVALPPRAPPATEPEDTYELEDEPGETYDELPDEPETPPPRPKAPPPIPGKSSAPLLPSSAAPKLVDTVAIRAAKGKMKPVSSKVFEDKQVQPDPPEVITGDVKEKIKALDTKLQKPMRRDSSSSTCTDEGSGGSFAGLIRPPLNGTGVPPLPTSRPIAEVPGRDVTRPLPPVPTPKETHKSQKWFFSDVTEKKAADQIIQNSRPKDGTFLIRPSTRNPQTNPYSLHLWFSNRVYVLHVRNCVKNEIALGTEKDDEKRFGSVMDMVSHHMKFPIMLAQNPSKGESGGEVLLHGPPSN